MQYIIIEAIEPNRFETKVNKAIQNGWKPQGGVCVVIIRRSRVGYAQAMIKE